MALIIQFQRSEALEAAFARCADAYDRGPETYEWPINVFSQRMIVLESGRICREGDELTHADLVQRA